MARNLAGYFLTHHERLARISFCFRLLRLMGAANSSFRFRSIYCPFAGRLPPYFPI